MAGALQRHSELQPIGSPPLSRTAAPPVSAAAVLGLLADLRFFSYAFGAMRYRIRRAPSPEAAVIRLARVERVVAPSTAADAAAVVIEFGPVKIRVERGVDAETLATVLGAVGRWGCADDPAWRRGLRGARSDRSALGLQPAERSRH